MKLNEKQIRELKEVELNIFKNFISVCKKLNLKYYLLGGTLLGAVRHKGFIPWDDDIDVGMLRKDYEIFISKGQELLPKEYFIQNFYTDPEFPANFTKIRNSETTFIETTVAKININHGVFIDIFPLDFYPEGKNTKKLNIKEKLLSVRISSVFYTKNKSTSFKFKVFNLVAKLLYSSSKKAIIEREKIFKANKNGKYIANYCGAWGIKEIVPKEWFGDGIELEFEGIKVTAPTHYDKWLTQVYGDYMQLPPEEKRVAHHYVDIVDLNKSYTNYYKKEELK